MKRPNPTSPAPQRAHRRAARRSRFRTMPPPARPLALLTATAFALSLAGCGGDPTPPSFKANTGQIQVLNGSGRTGQAENFRTFLTAAGFDVIEAGNARSWNYEHTLVLARTASDTIARNLARVLGTHRVVHLQHPASLVEATVIVGKDYKELMRTWPQTENNQP